ncbi:phosphoglycerate mutase family protein [Paenibacillus sp. N3/727]|uniref:histidine phosphatase family protein n=1 Tax=Paenibacillus sp. N3/727 TaxID=2925845 RepID=UPI001F5306A6|nr:histidine phosphatase family protein [Paenibacillus sp. N3/727]UNK20293.1 phosphoglycerate mutase family protein [Paenibacillus sp. N3/727]
MKNIFLVRHCKAKGQEPTAELTIEGVEQSHQLAGLLQSKGIDLIITSPYKRAIESILPLCNKLDLRYTVDNRLEERVLSSKNLDNWMELLKETYENLEIVYEGGESSREAMNRGMEVINEIMNGPYQNVVVVTHGALMSLILKYFNNSIGYEEWSKLTNPDIYLISNENKEYEVGRIWM